MALCDIFKGQRITEVKGTDETTAPEESAKKKEKWIWVRGYKGTTSEMTAANDFQYELGATYTMPDDAEIRMCESGFHFSQRLSQAQKFYGVHSGNRFFEVEALVREEDWDYRCNSNKLVAKSIRFIREMTTDEILEVNIGSEAVRKMPEKYKELARQIGIEEAFNIQACDELEEFGYSRGFALYIANVGMVEVAKAVGSQKDLSMDMKALIIMQTKISRDSNHSQLNRSGRYHWNGR